VKKMMKMNIGKQMIKMTMPWINDGASVMFPATDENITLWSGIFKGAMDDGLNKARAESKAGYEARKAKRLADFKKAWDQAHEEYSLRVRGVWSTQL
jgi:hypothetical protein